MIKKYINKYNISIAFVVILLLLLVIYIANIYKFKPPTETTTAKSSASIKDLESIITDSATRREVLEVVDIYIKKYYLNPKNNFEIDRNTIKFGAPNDNDIETIYFRFKVQEDNINHTITFSSEGTKNIWYKVELVDIDDTNKKYSSSFSLLPEQEEIDEFINNNEQTNNTLTSFQSLN